MKDSFYKLYEKRQILVNEFLDQNLRHLGESRATAIQTLLESVQYSLLQGGKRFRPILCLLTAEAFGVSSEGVLPWAGAVELVHTYSLIHDDLPCMDNDDIRRGMATNHRVFGESTALLAGDALLTEAFRQVSIHYEAEPLKAIKLVRMLSEASGIQGMIGGQAIDMLSKQNTVSIQELNLMHSLKTGALIRVSCEGAAVALGLSEESQSACKIFGELLGLAFQLKDDLLDSALTIEPGSYPAAIGVEATQKYLSEVHQQARHILIQNQMNKGSLEDLIKMNEQRVK